MNKRIYISLDEAKCIGDCLYVDWDQVDLEQFRQGLLGRRRQGDRGAPMRPAFEGVVRSGQAVLAHMRQIPDYVVRLAQLRAELHQSEVRRGEQDPDNAVIIDATSDGPEEHRD